MLPTLIREQGAHFFNFYWDSSVRQGLRYGSGLYGCVDRFSAKDRLVAFNLAVALGESGHQTIITVSQESYRVWMELKSSAYPFWEGPNKTALAESSAA